MMNKARFPVAFCLATLVLFAFGATAFCEDEASEPSAIVELGGAGAWSVQNGHFSFGPDLGVETTPIENWLELEAGTTELLGVGETEWDADLLFKKPYTLSDAVEFMFGLGPEWDHTVTSGKTSDTVNAEAALDFMFWPFARRQFGWYLEPSYDYGFAKGHDQSLAISVGLLVALP